MNYLCFKLIEAPKNFVTKIWNVNGLYSGDCLGIVKWYPSWRRYCFFPKEGTVWERIVSSARTGLTMTITTLAAMAVGYIFADSLVLKQMFSIIFLGLIVDIISTYTMNAGLLKWYLERKESG